jgi:hypothetical protein
VPRECKSSALTIFLACSVNWRIMGQSVYISYLFYVQIPVFFLNLENCEDTHYLNQCWRPSTDL